MSFDSLPDLSWVALVYADRTVFYGEYKCIGEGANMTMRVPYTQGLNETQASPFLDISFIDGQQWLQPYQ